MKYYHNKFISLFWLIISCFNFVGCKSFVEVEAPKSQLLGELVFEDTGTVEAALAGVYYQLREGYGSLFGGGSMSMTLFMALYADELDSYNNTSYQSFGPNFYKHMVFVDSEDLYYIWTAAYNQIYNANVIIEGIKASTSLPEDRKGQLMGEAIFIRALVHFYLVNLFGDVPYVDKSDYLQTKDLSRMPEAQVYEHIIADLIEAESLTGEDYPSAERVRVNKYVVRALLARVYLYNKDWEKAEEMASLVIGNPAYTWVDDLGKVFLKESTGTIWAFKPALEGYNTEQAYTFNLVSTPVPAMTSISSELYSAFEPGDLRKQQWVGQYAEEGQSWNFSYKYKIRGNSDNGITKEYTIVLRLEEQYLIRAEARAQRDNVGGAQQDLNKIRHRAALDDTGAASKEALLTAILHERQVELFTEYGHRWFDLKRTGKAAEILEPIKPNWKTRDILLPIPDKELLVNPHLLPQNPGYGN